MLPEDPRSWNRANRPAGGKDVFRPLPRPGPGQRARSGLRPRVARARVAGPGARRRRDGGGGDPVRDRGRARLHRADHRDHDAVRAPAGGREPPPRGSGGDRPGGRGGPARPVAVERAVVGAPGVGVPPGGGAARRAVAGSGERRHDDRAVQDLPPGRDRRRVRAHRLLAVQRALHAADTRGAAAGEPDRELEPDGPPPARRVRVRGHPVQLHQHRAEPAHRAGVHGQHRRVEARDQPPRRCRVSC
jgi:hypothetical protein